LTGPLGDINADGLNDLAVLAADTGCCSDWDTPRAYIIFGTTATDDISLDEIENGNGGFIIYNDASNVTYEDSDFVYGAIAGSRL